MQESTGEICVAGTSLLTFDGERWNSFRIGAAYCVLGMDLGPDGRLWAAMSNDLGWFEKLPGGERRFHSLRSQLSPEDLAGGEIWSVYADGGGATFLSGEKVMRWDGAKFSVWTKPGERRLFSGRTAGVVFMHYRPEGLFTVDASGPHLLIPADALPGPAAILGIVHRDDCWILLTSEGFHIWRDGKLEPFAPEVSSFLREKRMTQFAELRDGRIAIGTLMGGFAVIGIDGRLEQIIDQANGLPSNSVSAFFVDREGCLWTTAGMNVVRIDFRSPTQLMSGLVGFPTDRYHAIVKVQKSLAVANGTAVITLDAAGAEYAMLPDLRGRFTHLHGSPAGLLAAGYHGAVMWDGDKIQRLLATPHDVYYALERRGSPGRFFASLAREIHEISGTTDSRQIISDLPSGALSMAEDEAGRLWIGTHRNGVLTAKPNATAVSRAEPVAMPGLPPLDGLVHVRAARDGAVLVVANGGAWFRPTWQERFVAVSGYPARDAAAVSEVAPDGATFWVGLNETESRAQAIGRIEIRGAAADWTAHAVDALDQIGRVQCILADRDEQERPVLWVGGTRSVLRHTVEGALHVPVPRQPVLRVFTRSTSGAPRAAAEPVLRYDTHAIEAEFAVPQFGRRAALRLESRIDGLESDWTTVGLASRRELSGMRDGHYAVRVRAVSEVGVPGPEAVFDFRVLPPWWRSRWFLTAAALLAAPLAYGAHRFRVRSLRQRNAALQAKIRERTKELELASAAKTEFVANMSHDIRNPLNGIVGLALALEQTRLDSRQREFVATLRECTTYLSSLVDDVLDFASIEAGKFELRPGPFAPPQLLRSVAETLKGSAAQRGATLSITTAADLPSALEGDAGRIQQVLVNFATNAIKYAGGAIELGAMIPEGAAGEVEFFVRDAGPGVAAADQKKLFTKFARLGATHRADVTGNGLGLAACRLLADRMGGSVGVESQAGAGSRFFLRLPLAIARAPEAPLTEQLPAVSVLLVEDEDYNAWAASAVLAKLGLHCERARTGEEALRRFAERRFTVVLLDRNLPDMDGLAIASRIRATEGDGAPALLLAVTAYCTAEDKARCLEAGMDAFVGKPLTPEKLRRELLAAGRRLLTAASMELPAEVGSAAIDTALLNYLSDGSVEDLAAQIQRFVESVQEAERQLDEASARHDFPRVREVAHHLLSRARFVGGAALVEAARHLEDAAAAADGMACGRWLKRVHAEADAITAAISRRHPTANSS